MSIHNRSISIPAYSRPANPNLILKHEILSGECDVFRASLPRRVYATRLGRLTALVIVVAVLIQITGNISTPLSAGTMAILVVTVIAVLSRTIEERILFIKGLGVQYTRLNGFHRETCCNFYPFESIDQIYLFEAIDGFKYGHFLTIRLKSQENIVLFQNMKPPVEFLKRVYRKYEEIKKT